MSFLTIMVQRAKVEVIRDSLIRRVFMAIVRCEIHPVQLRFTKNKYFRRVRPIGYPDTACICGHLGCKLPGLVWLTKDEVKDFNNGNRYFEVKTFTIKVKVVDDLLPLP